VSPGWPVVLRDGPVVLRQLRMRDAGPWIEVRLRNENWLAPWESAPMEVSSLPFASRHSVQDYLRLRRALRRQARLGVTLPFAIEVDGALAGQVTIFQIVRGASCSGLVGYWVDRRVAGRGVAPTAVALAVDHAFRRAGLHRVEAGVRPENAPSRRVMEKLGFRLEGCAARSLVVDGQWRDHLTFALTVEDVPEGLLQRLRAQYPVPAQRSVAARDAAVDRPNG
jgi:ribosomal-protein-alanine N-acetyltransferase